MEFAAARKFLSDRLNMPTEMTSRVISEEIPLQVRAHCFFSARVAESHVLERLRGISDAYGNGEIDLATAREKFKRWYDQEKPGQRFDDGEGMQNIASTMRLNLVFRQNAAMAAAVGRYQVGRDPAIEERWPCWRYVTGSNPRDAHAALDGRVFLKSDPIWHKIYPPWEFNCNCDVEDAELPEGGADKIEPGAVPPAKSGYAFDPAEAFKQFDLSLLQGEAKEDFELAYGGAFDLKGQYAMMDKGMAQRISSKNLNMTSAKEWKNLGKPPSHMSIDAARKLLEHGKTITDPHGEEVIFNMRVLEHWVEVAKTVNDINGRLSRLKWGFDTVESPREIWTDLTQRTYIKAYQMESVKTRACVVAVKHTGEVHTYFIEKATQVDKARKGLRVEEF